MPTKTEKLIKEYKNKISLCDFSLAAISDFMRKYQHPGISSDALAFSDAYNEQRLVSAQRQYYVQFVTDLDSLSD